MHRLSTFLNSTAAARIATIVLLAILTGLLTHFFLKLMYGDPAPAVDAANSLSLPSVAPSKPTPTWLQGANSGDSNAPPIDIKLLGVVAQGETGYALIQSTGKRPQVLRVGQSLADGTQLLSVKGKTATLSVAGVNRNLNLEPNSGAVAVNNAPPMPPQIAQNAQAGSGIDSASHAAQIQQMQQAQQMQAAAAQSAQGGAESAAAHAESGINAQIRRRSVRVQ